MSKRIKLAKNLLKDKGIIICAIDDYECQNIRHLFDEIFGENNRLGTTVVIHNPGGRQDDKFFATAHEYMLIYAKNKENAKVGHLDIPEKKLKEYKFQDEYGKYKLREYRRSGANSRPTDRPNLWYPIYIDPNTHELFLKNKKGCKKIIPIDPEGIERVWRWNAETFIERKDKYIEIKNVKGKFQLYVKERLDDNKGQKPKTIWNESYYSSAVGTQELKNILHKQFGGKKIFDFPKSKFLVRDILEITTNENSIVLDFFAGSGTTGQAVLELNQKKNENRTFILCTNDENKICTEVCYPRTINVIKGYKTNKKVAIEGIRSNLKDFRTKFVKKTINKDALKTRITLECTEMLCLREGIFEEVKQNVHYRIFRHDSRVMGVYYSLEQEGLKQLKRELDKLPGEKILYCFTLDPLGLDEHDFHDWEGVTLEPIPQKILDVYESIYEY